MQQFFVAFVVCFFTVVAAALDVENYCRKNNALFRQFDVAVTELEKQAEDREGQPEKGLR